MPLFTLTKWLRRRTGRDDNEAVLQWRLLSEAFPANVVSAYREGMRQLWRVTKPERPEHKPGGAVTVKWITILSFAAVGLEASTNENWAQNLSTEDARRAALHACMSGQGYPDWIESLLAAHPATVVPIVHAAFEAEWLEPESFPTDFVYRYGGGITSAPLRQQVLGTIVSHDPPKLVTLDYGLRTLHALDLDAGERTTVRRWAFARLDHSAGDQERALRYIAMLFIVDGPAAVTKLVDWLDQSPKTERKGRAERAVAALFGRHDPLVPISPRNMPVAALEKLLRFTYANIRPQDDNVREGSYTPDARDNAESGRNAVLKALLDTSGEASYAAVTRLSRSRLAPGLRLRFRELARGMAERDTEPPEWKPADILDFERRHVLPVKTAADLYRVVLSVLDEIAWDFDHQDASSRAVLETAKDENAVQHWVAEQLRLRAHGRYHVHRELEIAEGNLPDIVVSGTTVPFEVAVEVKHSDKGWTFTTLVEGIKDQLAEDYLRPANRRDGVLIVTRHKKKGWRDPQTGRTIGFEELVDRLSTFASSLTLNAVGCIHVGVRGVDAAPRQRRRSRDGAQKVKRGARG